MVDTSAVDFAVKNVKDRVGVGTTDTSFDILLTSIATSACQQFQLLLGMVETIPDELAFILTEVSLVKFNSYRAEGFQSKGQDGYSFSKFSPDDFDPYRSYISMYLNMKGLPDVMNATVTFIGGEC